MTKLRTWHKSLIAILITATIIVVFGPKKLIFALILIYVILLPTIYLIERKKKLSFWQERLIVSLIVFPLLSLFISAENVLALFIGSLLAGVIIFLSGNWKGKEQEIIPEWEERDSEEKENQIKEASRNKT
jgi:hypothetical protein